MDVVMRTLAAEFSDLGDPEQLTRLVLRLLLAALLGGLLGWERESKGKSAGLRTHMLVAIGAAVFVMIPQQHGLHDAELSRIVQGVIAGIGFLCAGTIIKGRGEEQVQGLTTAAGLWLTAAIGVAVGLGREASAVLSTLLALVIFSALPALDRAIERRQRPPRDP
jgi:putative Mg2+ transporter-C (MgtC) family protein